MGSSNGITRGQLRPHFSGRSPPFLVAALCVGLGILGVSYWSLCSQYNDLEQELKKALQQSDNVKKSEDVIQNQLHLREEEFSRAKKQLQTKEQELIEFQNQLKSKTDEINSLNSRLESIKDTNTKCNEDLVKKENELGDAFTKLKDIEQQNDKFKQLKDDQNKDSNGIKLENERLKIELEELRKKLNDNNINNNNNNNSASSQSPVANVGQPPSVGNNVLPSDKIENAVNKPTEEKKETQKSQAEPPINAENIGENVFSVKQQESVIAVPNRMAAQQQSPAMNGLGEEDKKEDSLVPVDAMSPNEIVDEMKGYQNKEEEESKDRQI